MSQQTHFRKKPVVVEAIQNEIGMAATITDWMGRENDGKTFWYKNPRWEIKTLEGVMTVERHDWIIKGVKGEFYPCKPDIFEATYEPADAGQWVPQEALASKINAALHSLQADGSVDRDVLSSVLREALARLNSQPTGAEDWHREAAEKIYARCFSGKGLFMLPDVSDIAALIANAQPKAGDAREAHPHARCETCKGYGRVQELATPEAPAHIATCPACQGNGYVCAYPIAQSARPALTEEEKDLLLLAVRGLRAHWNAVAAERFAALIDRLTQGTQP